MESCNCNRCNHENECGQAIIKQDVMPKCPIKAVIPSIVVEDSSNLKNLAGCFVHVSNINTTYYIDDKHRIILMFAGDIYADHYDANANPLKVRSQRVIDFYDDVMYIFNATGEYRKIKLLKGNA